jgi:hypothetical protein
LANYFEARCNDIKGWIWGRSVVEHGAGVWWVCLTAAWFG